MADNSNLMIGGIMKKFIALLLAMVLVISLGACGDGESNEPTKVVGESTENSKVTEESNPEPVESDRPLVVATAEFSGDFHEGWSNASYDKNIRILVWGFGLMDHTPQGEIVDSPLVEEKTVSDDMMEWTFKIKDGVTFHNGEELTASDVKFTYDFYMDKEALSDTGGSSSLQDYIEEVVIDEAANSVTFKLKKIIFTVDASLFHEVWILAEDTITEGAEAASQTVQEYVKTNIDKPIGYGPYMLDEYKESEYVRLKVFEDYIGTMPKIKEVIVRVVPTETQLDQLLQGEIDLISKAVEENVIDTAINTDGITSTDYYRHGGGTMVLHTDYEAFALTEVRQAFAYVFNRPKVIELYLGKYGISSNGPYSKNHWMMYDDDEVDMIGTAAVGKFEESLINYDILDADGKFDEDANIAKAHELLDAAVAKTDGEYANLTGDAASGYLWKGQPLEIKIAFTDFWSDTYHLVWNDAYVSKLGFNVTLNGLDWPIMYGHWIGDTTEERQYHAFVGGESYTIKANPKNDFSAEKIQDWGFPSDNGARFNGGSSYTPEDWEQLLVDIENCNPLSGRDEYRSLWRTFVSAMNKELAVIPVYSNNYHDLFSEEIKNLNTNALWDWTKAVVDAYWGN